ncbi:unnamed protein product [Rhizopus stolonifer]
MMKRCRFDTIKYNDIRQKRDQTLVRSKATCILLPNELIKLDAGEIEVVNTVKKLLATIRIVSPPGEDFYRHFVIFKIWPDMDLQTKIDTCFENACHELNFWINKVDPNFFKEIIHSSIKIEPQTSSLEPQTHYGCQLVLSNLSSKPVRCELTYQIPTGSVPLGSFSYRLSQSVYIQPYSTWSKISGTFYFPLPGTFGYRSCYGLCVEKQGRQSLTMTEPNSLSVVDRSKNKEYNATIALYWPTIASHGSNEDVLSFLTIHKQLEKININLIGWRMTDTGFARKVFDRLSYQRCLFSEPLWKYGVYHQFADIVRDLLHFRHDSLLTRAGQIFKSPLISTLGPRLCMIIFR